MPRWTPQALTDAQEAWSHIAEDNEVSADRVMDTVRAAADRLDRFPRLGRPGPLPDTRQFSVPRLPFKLVYRILDDGEVELLRVWHTARDWPKA
jgi:plasmid stabilization system protein ParE